MTTKPDSHSALNGVKVSGPAGASTPHPDLTAADPMEINAMANSHITPPAGDRQHVPTDQAAPELLPCPFCGEALTVNKARLAVHSRASDCLLRQQPVVVDDQKQVARWNRRADLAAPSAPAEVEGLVGGETRTLAVDAVWKPCVHGGGWWIAKNADGGDVLLSSDTPQATRTALRALAGEGGR